MKILKTFTAILLTFTLMSTQAQTGIPEGFNKGTIVMADGSSLTGYLKDNIHRDASVTFINETDKKKKEYDGISLTSVQFNNTKFVCIGGDFFKVISEGELFFLQKASNAEGKVFYNGLENVVSNGTEGKSGDYFICNNSNKALQKISKKNVEEVAANSFAGCIAAIEKAKAVNGDIAKVKDAVDIFNSRNNK